MSKSSQFESTLHPAESGIASDDAGHKLMPSHKDFLEFQRDRTRTIDDRCGLPDYTIDGRGDNERLVPTEKRKEYDQMAREALNSPAPNDGQPLSAKEKQLADQVAELSLKAQKDLATSTQDSKRSDDDKALHDIFEGLDSASAQRIIHEANKRLESNNLRIAQTGVGEVWLGSRDQAGGKYYLDTRLKEVDCAPSV